MPDMKHPIRAEIQARKSIITVRCTDDGTFLVESRPLDGIRLRLDDSDPVEACSPQEHADICRALGLALLVMGSRKGQGVAQLPDGGVVYGLERAAQEAELDGILDKIKWVFDDEQTPKGVGVEISRRFARWLPATRDTTGRARNHR